MRTCAVVILVFANLFIRGWNGAPLVQLAGEPVMDYTPVTELYFSVVTFSTLGFGDVTPCNMAGQIAVMCEVFLGYVMLGGLISIFAMKLVPPR